MCNDTLKEKPKKRQAEGTQVKVDSDVQGLECSEPSMSEQETGSQEKKAGPPCRTRLWDRVFAGRQAKESSQGSKLISSLMISVEASETH